jgi:hypothetical protein
VLGLGYAAEIVGPADIEAHLEQSPPRVIVVCIDDVDASAFMAHLRRAHRGAAIPVTLCGHLETAGLDLADVLDLGADHFIDEPVADDALEAALEALAGPPLGDAAGSGAAARSMTMGASPGAADASPRAPVWPEPAAPVIVDEPVAGSWPTQTEVIDESIPKAPQGGGASARGGQMQRAFGILEARRPTASEVEAAGDSADDLDLAMLGLDDARNAALDELEGRTPPGNGYAGHRDGRESANDPAIDPSIGLGIDPGDSNDRLEVAELRVIGPLGPASLLGVGERAHRASHGPRETTVLLEDSGPVAPSRGSTTSPRLVADVATSEILDAPVLATTEFAERPRRHVPLPLEHAGDLAGVEVPRLVSRLHRASFTGRLVLVSGRVEKSIWFDDGAIVFARSSAGHDRLLDGLLRCGMLTRSQYEEARRLTESEGRRAGQVLVEAGFLKQSEMLSALQDHLARIVDSTLPWREGTWAIEPQVRCAEPIQLTIPTAVLLFEGIRQRMEPARLLGLLGGPRVHPHLRDGAASRPLALTELSTGLQLLPGEETWLPLLDGRSSLGDLLARPGADEAELLVVVYGLHVLELVDMPGEPLPMPRVVDDPVAIDRERVRARLVLAREADYFALLGLPRDATRADVRVAWADLERTFGDARLEPASRVELASDLAELRAAMIEARDVLGNDMLRNAYLAQLDEP